YEPNPQTGGPQTIEFPDDALTAENTIHHNSMYASRIIAYVPQTIYVDEQTPARRYIESNTKIGNSTAVVVADLPLVHTAQLLPAREGNAAAQLAQLFRQLNVVLDGAYTDLGRTVKLNF